MIFLVWARNCRRCTFAGIPRGGQIAESVPRRNCNLKEAPGSEVTPPGGAKARDGHVTARRTPERGPAKHRKTLLPRIQFKFSASESRDPRGPQQHAISPQRVRKGPANAGRIRHPLRGGGNACVSPAGTPVGTRAMALVI